METVMKPSGRIALCGVILATGFGAQAGLGELTRIERPPLRAELATVSGVLGDWVGHDVPVDSRILKESQATDYLNRDYENRSRPGLKLRLWVNYSRIGDNLRHTPKICLPSGGWTEVESLGKLMSVPTPSGRPISITRLGYSQGELVQGIGFWYYIFGEGRLEHYVRRLSITNRSSHGRTTRGSGMTVEVFCPVEADPDGEALCDFARALLAALEPIMPTDRAEYFVP
jgi:hypothetical protein